MPRAIVDKSYGFVGAFPTGLSFRDDARAGLLAGRPTHLARRRRKEPRKKQSPPSLAGSRLIPATSYSPTEFPLQYHRR